MGTNRPWNWRLTVLKTIKMMLVRPPHDQFQGDCQSWLCCFCKEPPRSVYKSSCMLIVGVGWGNWPLDRSLSPLPSPPPPLPAFEIKQTFLSPALPLYWLLSGEEPDPLLVTASLPLWRCFLNANSACLLAIVFHRTLNKTWWNKIHTLCKTRKFYTLFIYLYLFLAVLGLRFCVRAFSSCSERGPLFIAVCGPLTVAASLAAEHRLQTRRLSSCGSRA